jgi:hypothetical protein
MSELKRGLQAVERASAPSPGRMQLMVRVQTTLLLRSSTRFLPRAEPRGAIMSANAWLMASMMAGTGSGYVGQNGFIVPVSRVQGRCMGVIVQSDPPVGAAGL